MAINPTGSAVTFDSGFCAEMLSFDAPGWEREVIDISHMGTTVAKVFMPGDLYDPGEFRVRLAVVPGTEPPMVDAAEEIVLTWSDGSTWTFDGFAKSYSASAEMEARGEAELVIKVTGAIAVAAAS